MPDIEKGIEALENTIKNSGEGFLMRGDLLIVLKAMAGQEV